MIFDLRITLKFVMCVKEKKQKKQKKKHDRPLIILAL